VNARWLSGACLRWSAQASARLRVAALGVAREIGKAMGRQEEKSASTGDAARDAGFTLVETLVALAVLALSLGVLFEVASDALHRTSRAEKLSQAGLALQTLLARVGADIPLEPGEPSGQLGNGLRWRMRIEPYGDAADQQAWPVSAYKVSVEVRWPEGLQERSVSATTLRLGAKESVR
jgi:general secretion pathway protein I